MRTGRRGLLGTATLLVSLVSALAAIGAASAGAAVYWGNNGFIGAANLDGTGVNPTYFRASVAPNSVGPPCDIAVSAGYLYWAGSFGIERVNLEGPATPTKLVTDLQQPCGITLDASHMYWTNRRADTVARANLDGSEASGNLVPGIKEPCDVAAAGGYLYWINFRGIGRARLDGSEPDPEFVAAGASGCGIAVDAGHIYWSSYSHNQHSIGRANLDGSEPNPEFIPGLPGSAGSIALDPTHIYWTEWHEGMVYGTIGRANLDGTDASSAWIQTQWFDLGGLAVDARPTPPPLPLPSGLIRFGQVRHDLSSGITTLDVWVPRRGELAVTAPTLGWKVLTGSYPAALEGSFRWRLKIWPGKRGRTAKNLRAQLKNKGRAVVTVHLSYAETGQLPYLTSKRLSLLKTKPHVHR